MLGFIKGLFSESKVVDSAMKIVDKIAGTDFTTKEKADFVLKYQEATKHQSPARRFVAVTLTGAYVFMSLLFVLGLVADYFLGVAGASDFSDEIKSFMADNIKEPFNYVIIFYFGIAAINGIKS